MEKIADLRSGIRDEHPGSATLADLLIFFFNLATWARMPEINECRSIRSEILLVVVYIYR